MEVYVPDTQAADAARQPCRRRRTRVAPSDAALVRQALRRVEPDLAIERIQTTGELVQSVLSPARLLTTLMSLLGGTGLLLLALGIFGAAATALRAARGGDRGPSGARCDARFRRSGRRSVN